ncbi:MAG: hypothetical protein ACJ75J_18210 [Cytophagaceae bacterium]|jgi:hypothetical protein
MRNVYLLICGALIFAGCSEGYQLQGFDKKVWQLDKKGCEGKRKELVGILIQNKPRFKGMDDDDLLNLLGKPEKTVYYGRGRKDYSYFINPGNQCQNNQDMPAGSRLLVEFDALGYVNIITLQN